MDNEPNNKQPAEYQALIKKLIQLGLIDWPKLREMHSAEIKPLEPTTNIHTVPPKKIYRKSQNKYRKKKIILIFNLLIIF